MDLVRVFTENAIQVDVLGLRAAPSQITQSSIASSNSYALHLAETHDAKRAQEVHKQASSR